MVDDYSMAINSGLNPWASEQLCIRHLVREDLKALEWNDQYTQFRRLYKDIFHSTRDGRAIMWVVELQGIGVIGQLFVQLSSTRHDLADGLNRAYIYAFRIQPPYRGFGVGSKLLHFSENDLLKRRFRWITLNVGKDNSAARRFYERNGYRISGEEEGEWSFIDNFGLRQVVHEPSWRMEKDILQVGIVNN